MNRETLAMVIFLICFLILPYGIDVLLNGPMFGPQQYMDTYIVVFGFVIILALLALLVMR